MSRVIPFPVAEPVAGERARLAPIVPLHGAAAASRRRHRSRIAAAESAGRYGDVDGLTAPWSAPDLPPEPTAA